MTKITLAISSLIFLVGSISSTTIPKIVGGNNADIKYFPYLISIRYNGEHSCGGSIISDRHILTAAHCMYEVDEGTMDNLTIHSGTSRTDRVGDVHRILSIHSHSEFNITNDEEGYPHDIAVITLKSPIVFNERQQKINLPIHNVQDYQVAYVVGWGMMTKSFNWKSAKQLQKLRVALLPYDKCKSLLRHKMSPAQVCSFRGSKSGACHGDSGGPLVSHGEVVGIVSFGDAGKCAVSVPDVYTNVFAYTDFIESMMNK